MRRSAMVIPVSLERRDLETSKPWKIARNGDVAAHLSQEEPDCLGPKARTREDHVGLTLASQVPDHCGTARCHLGHNLVDAESP
jgi:hypothetical protein